MINLVKFYGFPIFIYTMVFGPPGICLIWQLCQILKFQFYTPTDGINTSFIFYALDLWLVFRLKWFHYVSDSEIGVCNALAFREDMTGSSCLMLDGNSLLIQLLKMSTPIATAITTYIITLHSSSVDIMGMEMRSSARNIF